MKKKKLKVDSKKKKHGVKNNKKENTEYENDEEGGKKMIERQREAEEIGHAESVAFAVPSLDSTPPKCVSGSSRTLCEARLQDNQAYGRFHLQGEALPRNDALTFCIHSNTNTATAHNNRL